MTSKTQPPPAPSAQAAALMARVTHIRRQAERQLGLARELEEIALSLKKRN